MHDQTGHSPLQLLHDVSTPHLGRALHVDEDLELVRVFARLSSLNVKHIQIVLLRQKQRITGTMSTSCKRGTNLKNSETLGQTVNFIFQREDDCLSFAGGRSLLQY